MLTISSIWNSVWGDIYLDTFVIVKLNFDRPSMRVWQIVKRLGMDVWQIVERLGMRWMTLTNLNIPVEKSVRTAWQTVAFLLLFVLDNLLQIWHAFCGILDLRLFILCQVNVCGVHFARNHAYCRMARVVLVKTANDVRITVCFFVKCLYISWFQRSIIHHLGRDCELYENLLPDVLGTVGQLH